MVQNVTSSMDVSDIKALTFDVFGTVVDWRASITKEGQRLGSDKGVEADWERFADAWREGYRPSMDLVRRGELPWTNLDGLHRMVLDDLLEEFGITGLSEAEIDHFNRAWHRLTPWPDAVPGLARLRQRFVVATLSNGNVALLTNMAENAGLPWDRILSSEVVKRYKPDPEVYETAVELLGLRTDEVMMVAAHVHDLKAAQAIGMKAAHVPRPLEFGPHHKAEDASGEDFDLSAADFEDLADQLGC